jgi:hypothetical protein
LKATVLRGVLSFRHPMQWELTLYLDCLFTLLWWTITVRYIKIRCYLASIVVIIILTDLHHI